MSIHISPRRSSCHCFWPSSKVITHGPSTPRDDRLFHQKHSLKIQAKSLPEHQIIQQFWAAIPSVCLSASTPASQCVDLFRQSAKARAHMQAVYETPQSPHDKSPLFMSTCGRKTSFRSRPSLWQPCLLLSEPVQVSPNLKRFPKLLLSALLTPSVSRPSWVCLNVNLLVLSQCVPCPSDYR